MPRPVPPNRGKHPNPLPRNTSAPARTWVQLLAVDSQLSYEEPHDFSRWTHPRAKPSSPPSQFRWASLALLVTAFPALVLAATRLAEQPFQIYVPWVICSLIAGLWAFYEVPGLLRITASAFVTIGALSTAGFSVAVCCATITALCSWAAFLAQQRRVGGYVFLSNWAILVLSAAAAAMAFDVILGLPGTADLTTRLASNRFLLAFPAAAISYVVVNTSLASLATGARHRWPVSTAWKRQYSGIGLLFSVGILQSFSFIIAFGSWGAPGAGAIGTGVAFLIVLLLLGAAKQAAYQHEVRQQIARLATLLRTAARPGHRKHALARHLLEDLLAQGTRRFVSGIPPEELTFEAEEAVFDAEIAWKLGASEQSIHSYLMLHETPQGTGPFGRRESPLPICSPSFPQGVADSPQGTEPGWAHGVLRDLANAALAPSENLAGEHRKWVRLAASAARTIHSMLERYDYGRRLNLGDDLEWWQNCELAGFPGEPAREGLLSFDASETVR